MLGGDYFAPTLFAKYDKRVGHSSQTFVSVAFFRHLVQQAVYDHGILGAHEDLAIDHGGWGEFRV